VKAIALMAINVTPGGTMTLLSVSEVARRLAAC
jgi:hypothetical protein